jgi:capsular exopolysaccharide synthesis family protein
LRGEGKSATVSQLGLALAQVGKKVLIVDADMRNPTLHKIFDVAQAPGLSDILDGQQLHNDAILPLDPPGLYLLPAGPISRRSADLVSIGLSQVLTRISRDFDLILIDCPPVHQAAEAQEIAAMADGVLVLTKARGTSGKLVSSALFSLLRVRANVMGLVMNQVHDSDFNGYKYYAAADHNERIESIGA